MKRNQKGFTLIELLVVMAIIATLASIGMVAIPAIKRGAERTGAQDNLRSIFKVLQLYEMRHRAMPPQSGPAFVTAIWEDLTMDQTLENARVFFCPSTGREPAPDYSNITPYGIDWTGPDQQNRRNRLKTSNRNASEKVIVCHKVPAYVEKDEDLDDFPLGATGICYLTLGGVVDFAEASLFGEYPIIGPDSPVEKFQRMVPMEMRQQ